MLNPDSNVDHSKKFVDSSIATRTRKRKLSGKSKEIIKVKDELVDLLSIIYLVSVNFLISSEISSVEIVSSINSKGLDNFVVMSGDKIFDSLPAERMENFQTMLNQSHDRHLKQALKSYILEDIYEQYSGHRALGMSHSEIMKIDWLWRISLLEAGVGARYERMQNQLVNKFTPSQMAQKKRHALSGPAFSKHAARLFVEVAQELVSKNLWWTVLLRKE
jgi:hypothetical protein